MLRLFTPMRIFIFSVIVVVALAAVPRLLTYDFGLPYIDHPDEPNKYLGAQEWRGLYDSGGYYEGYPPGYVVVHLAAQYGLEAADQPGLAPAVRLLRLVSVLADLLTIVFIMLTARLAANTLAAVIAGLAWATAPTVLHNNVYALPDPMIALLGMIAVWLAAVALTDSRRRFWCVWSVVVALVATWLKYNALPLIAPGGLVALVILLRDRRAGLRLIAVQAALVIGFLGWLFFIYGVDVGSVEREGAVIRESGVLNLLNPGRLLNNVYATLDPLSPLLWVFFAAVGLIAYGSARRKGLPTVRLGVLGLCLSTLTLPWLVAAYTQITPDYRMRDVLPATAALTVVFGAAVAQIGCRMQGKNRLVVTAFLSVAVFLLVYAPNLGVMVQIVEARQPPDRRVELRQWADINLEPGTVLVGRENEKTFNPIWGGLTGRYWFDWWIPDDVLDLSPADWRVERGMSYVVLSERRHQQLEATDDGRAWLAPLLHLRDFDESPNRAPAMSVYRLWTMQTPTDYHFGDAIRLVGYDLPAERVAPGDDVTLRFYWQAPRRPETNYSLFVHLTPPGSAETLAQVDGAPARPERPTLTWDDPDETIISQLFTLTAPPELASGAYTLRVGVYDFNTGERLPITDETGESAGDSLALAGVSVGG